MNSCPVFVGDSLLMQESELRLGPRHHRAARLRRHRRRRRFRRRCHHVQFGGQYETGTTSSSPDRSAYESSSLDGGRRPLVAPAATSGWPGVGVKYQSGPLLASAMVDLGTGNFDSTRRIVIGGDELHRRGHAGRLQRRPARPGLLPVAPRGLLPAPVARPRWRARSALTATPKAAPATST